MDIPITFFPLLREFKGYDAANRRKHMGKEETEETKEKTATE